MAISQPLDSSRCYLLVSCVFVTPSPLVDHAAPPARSPYFSLTKPIIKSINNWAFFPLLLNLFSPLYILWDEGEACKQRPPSREKKCSVTLCFQYLKVNWVFSLSSYPFMSFTAVSFIYHLHSTTVIEKGTSDAHFPSTKGSLVRRKGNMWIFFCVFEFYLHFPICIWTSRHQIRFKTLDWIFFHPPRITLYHFSSCREYKIPHKNDRGIFNCHILEM